MIQAAVLLAAMAATSPISAGASISPAVVSSAGTASQVYTVANQGNTPERFTVQVLTTRPVSNKPGMYAPDSEYSGYTVSGPAWFVLAPHASKAVTVTIKGDGYAKHLIVASEAITVKQAGTARVHVAAMARWDVTGKPGHAPSAVTIPTPHKSGSVPVVPVVVTSLLLGILAACGRYLVRRRRRTA